MAKNKRVKSDEPSLMPISSWAEADQYLGEMVDLELKIRKANTAAVDDIKEIKTELAGKVAIWQDQMKLRCRYLEAFADANKNDFSGARSKQLNFGTIGWRKSTSISIKKTTLELIKSVFSPAKAKSLIITKEDPSKEALAKLTDEDLGRVAARRVVRDDFFAEPDLPEAVDYTE